MRKKYQLIPPGELAYISATATDRTQIQLLGHIQAMADIHDKLVDGLQQVHMAACKPDGYNNPIITLERVKALAANALGGLR